MGLTLCVFSGLGGGERKIGGDFFYPPVLVRREGATVTAREGSRIDLRNFSEADFSDEDEGRR